MSRNITTEGPIAGVRDLVKIFSVKSDKGGAPLLNLLSATLCGKTTAPAYLDNHCRRN